MQRVTDTATAIAAVFGAVQAVLLVLNLAHPLLSRYAPRIAARAAAWGPILIRGGEIMIAAGRALAPGNVMGHGAANDAATDDTAAVQAAIKAVMSEKDRGL